MSELKQKTVKDLALIPNCEITNYNPLGLNINPAFNYRNHRKISIIEGRIAYCGGDNLADEYIHKKERFGHWRDNGMKIVGDACYNYLILLIILLLYLNHYYMIHQLQLLQD